MQDRATAECLRQHAAADIAFTNETEAAKLRHDAAVRSANDAYMASLRGA